MIVTYTLDQWASRCRRMGVEAAAAEASVIRRDAGTVVADNRHSAYPRHQPGLIQKVGNFAASAVKHAAAGMPMASEEEVARRFAICQGCEHFDGKACRKCGCPVMRERRFISKLSWSGESCPVGKWV